MPYNTKIRLPEFCYVVKSKQHDHLKSFQHIITKEESKLIKARNRKLSMLLVLAMLMTMFVGVGAASAAENVTFSPINSPVYSTSTDPQTVDAEVLVKADDAVVFGDRMNMATIKLPKGVEFREGVSEVYFSVIGTDPGFADVYASIKSKSAVDFWVDATDGYCEGEVKFLLVFEGLVVKSGSGDLNVTLVSPSGSAFPGMGTIKIGSISAKGSVNILPGAEATFGDGGGAIDGMTIAETTPGTLKAGDVIKFKLAKGFVWEDLDNQYCVFGGWGFNQYEYNNRPEYFYDPAAFTLATDGREMTLTINYLPTDATQAGRITIGTDGFGALSFLGTDYPYYPIVRVEDTAKFGDIVVSVSSDNNKEIPKTDIVVGNYGDYTVKVLEGTKETVKAGRTDQEIGKFYIEEGIAGTMIAGRTLYLELPKGVKWVDFPEIDAEDGDLILDETDWSLIESSKGRKIKTTVTDFSLEAAKMVFEEAKVKVAPSFSGPIDITVSGSAGAEGTVTVAEAVQIIEVAAENPTKVIIGEMNQKAGDILITETEAEAILDGVYNKEIVISLPRGVFFASKPNVTVESGDIDIDTWDTDEISGFFNDSLNITVKYSSSKASVIRISDIYLTVDRTVPEGNVEAKFEGAKYYGETNAFGCTAFVDWDTDESLGSVVIAKTITPAQGAGSATFKVGANIYTVNNVSKVMDVAPYIKDSRTYVPMRYLGEVLGAEVVWDATARTVTLTKGDTVVVFTVGSTSYTVNGEAKTADVAPEIVNDRTMLPARFVAEAFGATVGWDGASGTVLIQMQ